MDNKWNKNLRDRFSEYSSPEPEGLWESIEEGLEKPSRKGAAIWYPVAAAAAVAAIVFVAITRSAAPDKNLVAENEVVITNVTEDSQSDSLLHSQKTDDHSNGLVNSQAGSLHRSQRTVAQQICQPEMTDSEANMSDVGHREIETAAQHSETDDSQSGSLHHSQKTVAQQIGQTATTDSEVNNSEVARDEIENDKTVKKAFEQPFDNAFQPERRAKEAGRGKISVGVYGHSPFGRTTTTQGYGFIQSQKLSDAPTRVAYGDFSSLSQMYAANTESSMDVTHFLAFRAGLSASYSWNDHWAVSSGLQLSLLISDFVESSGQVYVTTDNFYLMAGIPLQIQYGWRPTSWIRIYALGGIAAETCIDARTSASTIFSRKTVSSSDAKTSLPGIWWTASAGAGAQIALSEHWGLYFEPSLEYHLPNGSEVDFLYTSRSFSPALSVGLRYKL